MKHLKGQRRRKRWQGEENGLEFSHVRTMIRDEARVTGPTIIAPVKNAFGSLGLALDPLYLVPPIAKVAVTPVTMYLNYLAMGIIIEQRIRFR